MDSTTCPRTHVIQNSVESYLQPLQLDDESQSASQRRPNVPQVPHRPGPCQQYRPPTPEITKTTDTNRRQYENKKL